MFRILNSCLLYLGKRINVMTVVFARIENSCQDFFHLFWFSTRYTGLPFAALFSYDKQKEGA